MMTLLFLVLSSGILQFSFAANRLQIFEFTNESKRIGWDDALNKCDNQNASLLSLYEKEDADMICNFTGNIDHPIIWLGLKKSSSYVPTWSNGKPVIFNESTVTLQNDEQLCEAIENGTWKGCACSEKKSFICQNGSDYIFVNGRKNWCQALQHCKATLEIDFASINDEKQNENLKQKSRESGVNFWIGLKHDKFESADKSCSTYRNVNKSKEMDEEKECFILDCRAKLKTHQCGNEEIFLCYKGSVNIRLIQEPKTWEEALNFCTENYSRLLWIEDVEDQKAVVQWLNYTRTNPPQRLWIGLKQSSVFGFWIWSDRIVNYHNWKGGIQPEMFSSNQCGVIDPTTYNWSNENCYSRLPFLCEEDIGYLKRPI